MGESKPITLTYLNIRQSISILIAKLVVIDLALAVVVIFLYYLLVNGNIFFKQLSSNAPLFLIIFSLVGFIKIALTIYTVLLWLNEYYEITPEHIVHRRGIIFKKRIMYKLANVRQIGVEDSFLGEMFNFGTITFYELRLNKYIDMYLIHNPRRYAKVLKQMKPDLELKEDHVWLPFLKKGEDAFEDDEEVKTSEVL